MKTIRKTKRLLLSGVLGCSLFASQASALNIVLTNDDGWETANITVMAQKLRDAGHQVIMSAPCTGQSGKGGAMTFLRGVVIDKSRADQDEYCVGDTDTSKAHKDYVEGTPVMAALHGIDVLAQKKWGSAPDLVISGPNEGNNLGYMNNNSGTLGAAMISIIRGIPAIAVSAGRGSTQEGPAQAAIADIVLNIISKLESRKGYSDKLLPPFMGLNVNIPDNLDDKGYKFTNVGWNPGEANVIFREDLSQDPVAVQYVAGGIAARGVPFEQAKIMAQQMLTGQPGLSFDTSGYQLDTHRKSEGVALANGYITISTIDAHIQAGIAKKAFTRAKLSPLP